MKNTLTLEDRMHTLDTLGLKYNSDWDSFVLDDFNYSVLELKCDSDEEFNKTMVEIKREMLRRVKEIR